MRGHGALAERALGAGSVGAAVAQEPPIPHTRRVDLTGQPFGAGRHECPGRSCAIAIVEGLLR